jgi:DNA-binding transcriptional ArsR family regulator
MDEITILQAEVLKTLASPRRIEILHALATGPIEVGRLATSLGARQPNVSQHLAVLVAPASSRPSVRVVRFATA